MKKYIYILLVVIIMGLVGVGCVNDRQVIVADGKVVSYRVYDVNEMDNRAYCDIVIVGADNSTKSFSNILMALRAIPQPIDSQKVYKVIKYDRDFGCIWYKLSEK